MCDRYYVGTNSIGCFTVCDSQRAIPQLPGQRYGYTKRYNAQRVVDDLNSGKETPESMYKLWTAGKRPLR